MARYVSQRRRRGFFCSSLVGIRKRGRFNLEKKEGRRGVCITLLETEAPSRNTHLHKLALGKQADDYRINVLLSKLKYSLSQVRYFNSCLECFCCISNLNLLKKDDPLLFL